MKQRTITRDSINDVELKQLYQTAFPENEKIPWNDLMRLVEEMHLDFTAYYDEEALIGFTIVYSRPSFSWFWYFAVKEELRGRGQCSMVNDSHYIQHEECFFRFRGGLPL